MTDRPDRIDAQILRGIAGALAAGEKLTSVDTLPRWGCVQPGRYMSELQRRGWKIKSRIISLDGDRYMQYRAERVGKAVGE